MVSQAVDAGGWHPHPPDPFTLYHSPQHLHSAHSVRQVSQSGTVSGPDTNPGTTPAPVHRCPAHCRCMQCRPIPFTASSLPSASHPHRPPSLPPLLSSPHLVRPPTAPPAGTDTGAGVGGVAGGDPAAFQVFWLCLLAVPTHSTSIGQTRAQAWVGWLGALLWRSSDASHKCLPTAPQQDTGYGRTQVVGAGASCSKLVGARHSLVAARLQRRVLLPGHS
ncbi:hypothetical protein NDU88_001669 [Pleurodeles waltl]|uniref:Uncharacterized protein n=1 Tax=Pleurodeles waltl TaxID=8319 RepID=A0AAV7MLM8_PLEWA|nr:hypothetical protein NDU88_001669 [Pleurodeles waltl]